MRRCYFLRGSQTVGVAVLPVALSDEASIARAHILSSKRRGPIDGFEVWDDARLVIRHMAPSFRTVNEAAFGRGFER
jgi:hypothetical protein